MDFSTLKWDAAGLVTVVVQDRMTGAVRMVAHANEEALRRTLDTREAHFFSRSRHALWRKGESSGNVISVAEVWLDCDRDAVLYLADPAGPSCHTGAESCFFTQHDGAPAAPAAPALARLWAELESRRGAPGGKSYTRTLLDAGTPKIGAKLREEADELARALDGESNERVISECADVLYHALVGLLARGVTLRDVEVELTRRSGTSGLDEKAARGQR
jgi:phosphoribosyl-ATP pyrophosphohydrolase/phosphoribosyl-AMP cyclohydrolase